MIHNFNFCALLFHLNADCFVKHPFPFQAERNHEVHKCEYAKLLLFIEYFEPS